MWDWVCWDAETDTERGCGTGHCDEHVEEGQPNGCNDPRPCDLDKTFDSCWTINERTYGPPEQEDCEPNALPSSYDNSYSNFFNSLLSLGLGKLSFVQGENCAPLSCDPSSQSCPLPPTPPTPPTCDPRYGFKTYGCYCVEGDTCEEGYQCPPVDQLDAICKKHDMAYQGCVYDDRGTNTPCGEITRQADEELCNDARNLSTDGMSLNVKRYRVGIIQIFCE